MPNTDIEMVTVINVGVDALNYKDADGNTSCAFRGDKPIRIPKSLATSAHWKIVDGDAPVVELPTQPTAADESLADQLAVLGKLTPTELADLAKLTPEDIAALKEADDETAPVGMDLSIREIKAKLAGFTDLEARALFALEVFNAERLSEKPRSSLIDLVTPIMAQDQVASIN